MMRRLAFAVILLGLSLGAAGRDPADWKPSVRWRGANVLSMFIKGDREDLPPGAPRPLVDFGYRNPQEFDENDFRMMREWGLNFARIPLDYRYWIKDGNPEAFDETALQHIDRLIGYGRKYGVHIQLNFHRAPGYMVAVPAAETGDLWNDPKMQRLCCLHWALFARRYRDIPNDDLSFNLLNEPPDLDDARYGRVAKLLIDAIRREDPKRFIVVDGLKTASVPCRSLFGIPGIGQSLHVYPPETLNRSASAAWPISPDAPKGYFTTPAKGGWYAGPFVLSNAPAARVTLTFGKVSGRVEFRAQADGRTVKTFVLEPKVGDPDWEDAEEFKKWNVVQGRYKKQVSFDLARPAREFRLELASGDWAAVVLMEFRAAGGRVASLTFSADPEHPANFAQKFNGWDASFRFSPATGLVSHRYGDEGREYFYRNHLAAWEEAIGKGVFVMMGEFGVDPGMPHALALGYLKDLMSLCSEWNLGWAVWGLHRSTMGWLDTGRADASFEDFCGHRLDRAMLDVVLEGKNELKVVRPRCEGLEQAIGIRKMRPRLTWALAGDENPRAKASEVEVSAGGRLVWTGRTGDLFAMDYAGPQLDPGRLYKWRVRLTDADGKGVTRWSESLPFVVGLQDAKDWGGARWIGEPRDGTPRLGDGVLAVTFKPVRGAFSARVRCVPDGSGGVAVVVPEASAKKDDWNALEIRSEDSAVTARLNGHPFFDKGSVAGDGTLALSSAGETRVKSVDWKGADGRHLHDENFGGHLQELFHPAEDAMRDGQLVVQSVPFVHAGRLPKDCPRFRKVFVLKDKPVESVVASVVARGFYELWINGKAADPRRTMAPSVLTDRDMPFDTYDVTSLVTSGRNAVGLWLAPGYSDDFTRYGTRWLKPKRALLHLDVRYADGERERVVTDGSWETTAQSEIVRTSLYHGEVVDLTKTDPNWSCADGTTSAWKPVRLMPEDPACRDLKPNDAPPVRRHSPLRPTAIREPRPGVFVVDFGQNRAGVVEARICGKRGSRVRFHTSELVDKDGMIDPWTNRRAESTDEVVLAGTGDRETFLPRFTYHGFRYVEITGWPGRPTADDLTAWAVSADLEKTATFACSEQGLNWLFNAATWSMLSNFMSYPTDCPMRDERTACLMDSQAYEDAACQFFDMRAYYRRWLGNMWTGGLNPDWNGDPVTLAGRLWRHYGDRRLVEERYPLMKAGCEQVFAKFPDGVCTEGYGDWCAPNNGDWADYFNDVGVVNTVLFTGMLRDIAEAAEALGKADEARDWFARRQKVVTAFERKFRNPGTATYGDASQVTAVLPLVFDAVPPSDRRAVFDALVERIRTTDRGRFDTGIFGTRYIGDVLIEGGEADLFLDLFTQREYPGFGFMAAQGATTLWEQWSIKGGMNSHNHAMKAGAASTLLSHLAGIRSMKPGHAEILVRPAFPARLDSLDVTRRTVRGDVRVSWKRADGKVALEVFAPPFTPTTLELPDGSRRVVKGRVACLFDPAARKPREKLTFGKGAK